MRKALIGEFMAKAAEEKPTNAWMLPPLILHPFSDATGPSRLVESSRASLMLQGLLPNGELTTSELEQRLLDGRYCELRMLYYVGRDLVRWIEQCLEYAESHPNLRTQELKFQSFATYLVENTPSGVVTKLKAWGVADYKAIFMRALGLNCVFGEVPDRYQLSSEFVRHYYRYADHMYFCRQQATIFPSLDPQEFDFELFASGEYTRMLEKEWETE